MDRIDNICRVDFSTLEDINSISYPVGGPAVVDATWQELEVAPGLSFVTITESGPVSGREFTTEYTGSLRTSSLTNKVGIIRITLEDGDQLLIGGLDLPVRLFESHQLKSKSIAFSHVSWHYPYSIQDGSGSSGSGL